MSSNRYGRPLRQGDVILIPLLTPPPPMGTEIARDRDRIVLAYGEVTGHAHAIAAPEARFYELATPAEDAAALALGERILVARKRVTLRHEEHDPIPIPLGNYIVRGQREYSPTALRRVED